MENITNDINNKKEYIDGHSLEDIMAMKKDLESLQEYYSNKMQRERTLKVIEDARNNISSKYIPYTINEEDDKKTDNKIQQKKEYLSKNLKEPKIDLNNFKRYLSTQIKKNDKTKFNFSFFTYKNLKNILMMNGEYPNNSRNFIWSYLLSLPNNKKSFEKIYNLGIHPFYRNLEELFPISDQKYLRNLKTICSILANWSNNIGNLYFLPNIVYPFIVSVDGDDLFIFELLISVLSYYCKYWVENYPSLPQKHITFFRDIINKESNNIIENCIKQYYKLDDILWRFMINFFSESLQKDEWLSFIDLLFTYNHKPQIFLYFACAFILHYKTDLKRNAHSLNNITNILFGINKKKDMKALFKETINLLNKYQKTESFDYIAFSPFYDYPITEKFQLDFIKVTTQLKDELNINDIMERDSMVTIDKKQKILEQKYKELCDNEKTIQYVYGDLIQFDKEKNELLKREYQLLRLAKENLFSELTKKNNI